MPTDPSWGMLGSVEDEQAYPAPYVPNLEIVVHGDIPASASASASASTVTSSAMPSPAGQTELLGELCGLLGIEVI